MAATTTIMAGSSQARVKRIRAGRATAQAMTGNGVMHTMSCALVWGTEGESPSELRPGPSPPEKNGCRRPSLQKVGSARVFWVFSLPLGPAVV